MRETAAEPRVRRRCSDPAAGRPTTSRRPRCSTASCTLVHAALAELLRPSNRVGRGVHRRLARARGTTSSSSTSSPSATGAWSRTSCSTSGPHDLRVPADSIDLANASTFPEARGSASGRALLAHVLTWAHEHGYPTMITDWRMTNLLASRFWPKRGFRPTFVRLYRSAGLVPRIPLLAGSRIAVVNTGDDAVVLAPPPPREPVADVAAAVRDALRFPLAGEPLEALVPRGGRATVVVEPPALPVPGDADRSASRCDRGRGRRARSAPASARSGRRSSSPAGSRAAARERELEALVPPEFARRFRGKVEVHDAESPDLVTVPSDARRDDPRPPRARRHRPRRDGQRRRDGPPRRARACSSPRRTRRRSAPPARTRCSRPRRRRAGSSGVALERALRAACR